VDLDPMTMLSHLDGMWLLLSIIPSGIGFVLFVYGKKQGRTPHLIAGVLLSLYPIVATTVTTLVVGGLLIGAGLWWAIRADW
jgi:ABC-type proline/glycine betaine transport system permease subunit